MDVESETVMFRIQCKAMVTELDSRLGDDNPYRDVDFGTMDLTVLKKYKTLLHELLYAPPPR